MAVLPFTEHEEILAREMASNLQERDGVIHAALAALSRAGFAVDAVLDRLFLDELITNAVVHGNRCDPQKTVSVRVFLLRDGGWAAEILDQGPGFDWEAHMSATQAPDPYQRSGRGLYLLRGLGAQLSFDRGGCCVVVVRPETLNTTSHGA